VVMRPGQNRILEKQITELRDRGFASQGMMSPYLAAYLAYCAETPVFMPKAA